MPRLCDRDQVPVWVKQPEFALAWDLLRSFEMPRRQKPAFGGQRCTLECHCDRRECRKQPFQRNHSGGSTLGLAVELNEGYGAGKREVAAACSG